MHQTEVQFRETLETAQEDDEVTTKNPSLPHLLFNDALRLPIEQRVSQYLDRPWRVGMVQSRNDSASHPAAILSDGAFAVLAKFGDNFLARDQFRQEMAGLRLLRDRAGVLTPAVIGNINVEDGAVLILEAAPVVERQPCHWRQMGYALARVHRVKSDRCGLETHSYWGDIHQDNQQIPDWPSFYRERRLIPRLKMALGSGHLPLSVAKQIDRLIARLPELCGPEIQPSLLHGDAHQNNFLSTSGGAMMIDPAVHYGHTELDLAYLDLFSPVPEEVFAGYKEMASIDAGFKERRDLWRVSTWLGIVAKDVSFLDRLESAVGKYL